MSHAWLICDDDRVKLNSTGFACPLNGPDALLRTSLTPQGPAGPAISIRDGHSLLLPAQRAATSPTAALMSGCETHLQGYPEDQMRCWR